MNEEPTYENAPMTTMQAVVAVAVSLRSARLSANPKRLQVCLRRLLEAARYADYLKEGQFRNRIAAIHKGILETENVNCVVVKQSCAALEHMWDEMLRENNTRYIPME